MSDSSNRNIHPVTVPKWGIEMQEGTITGWLVSSGDTIEKGKDLVDIETDKIVNTMESPASGVLRRQLVSEGETLKVGELLGVIATADISDKDIDTFIDSFVPADASFGVGDDLSVSSGAEAESSQKNSETSSQSSAPKSEIQKPSGIGDIAVSPIARRLAEQLGVDLSQVTPSGRGGRISKEDVEKAAAQPADDAGTSDSPETASTRPETARTGKALTGRQLTQARRMAESKQTIPHFYLSRELDMRAALDAQQLLDVPLTSLIVQAVVRALKLEPSVNVHFADDRLHPIDKLGINIAVDTAEGLIAPLLDELDELDVTDIAARLRKLADRARARELGAADLKAGSITLSNLGMFGITQFSAIINPPQVAILAVGVVRPVHMEMEGPMIPAMNATLSCDHRAIDGATGARFLKALQKTLLEI